MPRVEPSSGEHFGRSFSGLESTTLVDRSCKLSTGRPVCCGVAQGNYSRIMEEKATEAKFSRCSLSKKYLPSPYEQEQMELAEVFDNTDSMLRERRIVEYLTSEQDLNDSFIWINRVKSHMQHLRPATALEERHDSRYLSRFEITQKCTGAQDVTWIEWIEPLTIHARNPFSLLNFHAINKSEAALRFPQAAMEIMQTGVMNNDYVLLDNNRKSQHSRRYLFDAGTSTFQSSLWWFTCMYLQQDVVFDRIFGWEYTLLEPKAFWEEVPIGVREKYHFYNAPMSSDLAHGNSPLRVIAATASANDFVAFKLDIDTPDVEIPTVLTLLADERFHTLVDEFFFELHFRCEIMMYLGWGVAIPEVSHGFTLRRRDAMKLFQNLRHHGIRSHFWP